MQQESCSGREASSCPTHGKVIPEKRAVSSIVLDDGTDSIRAVLFHEMLLKLGFSDPGNNEIFAGEKEKLLGKEMLFTGNVRNNSFFNTPELIIEDLKEVAPEELISELERH